MIFWIFLVLAVLANAFKGFCSKKLSGAADSFSDNVSINLWRSAACVIIGGVILALTDNSFALSRRELVFCMISGAAMTAFQLSWLLSLKNGAYMMVSAFSSASFIIPCICGFAFLDEGITLPKGLAIAVICVAIYFLCRYNNKTKTPLSVMAFVFLVLVSVSQGINQIFQKLYSASGGTSVAAYSFYMFVFSTLITLILKLILNKKSHGGAEKRVSGIYNKRALIYIALSSVGIYAANYFQAAAAKGIDATVMYPLLNGLSLCAGTSMSIFLFGEKPKKESVIGILLVFTALMLNTAL